MNSYMHKSPIYNGMWNVSTKRYITEHTTKYTHFVLTFHKKLYFDVIVDLYSYNINIQSLFINSILSRFYPLELSGFVHWNGLNQTFLAAYISLVLLNSG